MTFYKRRWLFSAASSIIELSKSTRFDRSAGETKVKKGMGL
ncbi:hypothetical protein HOLDEFILI_03489 [Holdemania filiformis DSM 12042]|uniref:Uncharacterized protein n=1 Tax=Holdemania filiformis DSM 12042 TaxID=545696 RepID=B9YCD0_9FIRM|nr:hypothetical protein HOLDEFILI_03489 [Holdemania filiformis DSM 12042]